MLVCEVDKDIHRVCVQELKPLNKTTIIQLGSKLESFRRFNLNVRKDSKFKVVFLRLDNDNVLRIVGVLLDNIAIFNWTKPDLESEVKSIDIGIENTLNLKIVKKRTPTSTGMFFNLKRHFNPGERVRRPVSQDLARRYEYSEFYRPTVSVLGLCEIGIPVPFWQERWKSHEKLLLSKFQNMFMAGDEIDMPKLTYCILGMFGWRTKYTSDKQDMLLQQILVNYRGDCEDQALEQAKVIRSILALRAGSSWLNGTATARFIHDNVANVYLVSGAANPCLSGDVIGHCWTALKLNKHAVPGHFGLTGEHGAGRFAYIEGTTPVSWGWTLGQSNADTFPEFNGAVVRIAQKAEYQKLHYIFNEEGRWTVLNGANAPFEFTMNSRSAEKDKDFSDHFLRHLQEVNLNFQKDRLKEQLRQDWNMHCRYLIQFDNMHLQEPEGKQENIVYTEKQNMYDQEHLVLDRSDCVLGPFWTTSNTVCAEAGPGHGSLN